MMVSKVAAGMGLILATAWPASADIFPSADTFTTICLSTSNEVACKANAESFAVDWEKARAGDYQAQRNVAYCLTTGCDGATIVDRVEGCAWRMIIQGSSVRQELTERESYRLACDLGNGERRQALDRAEVMFKAIYRKRLPLKKLLRD